MVSNVPIMLLHELTEDMEILDIWNYENYKDVFHVAIHDHSRCYGEVEIFETLICSNSSIRYMWE